MEVSELANKINCHIFVIFTFLLSITIVLAGCDGGTSKPEQVNYFEEKIETQDFVMMLKGPKQIEVGEKFNVTGTLEYKGEEPIELFHGEPIIDIWIKDENKERIHTKYDVPENYGYTDEGHTTSLDSGDKMQIKDTSDIEVRKIESRRKIDSHGSYFLDAKTTILLKESPAGELFEGKNYERFIDEDMTERVKELQKSKIAIEKPIEVTVY